MVLNIWVAYKEEILFCDLRILNVWETPPTNLIIISY
jgi:hypothetical protein